MKVLGIISLFFLFLASCQNLNDDPGALMEESLPEQEGWDVEITLSEAGKVRAVIKANHLEKFESARKVYLDGNVNADFFNELEKHTTLVTSERASIEELTNIMMASGNVIVVSDSGITLVTDTLNLDRESELIFTDDSVRITTTGSDTLYGIGFESNLDLDEWRILKPWGVTEINNNE